MTNEEKLELAKKCDAIIKDVVPYDHRPEYRTVTFNEPTFLAYTSAIEEKYQEQIAMLRNVLSQVNTDAQAQEILAEWWIVMDESLSAAQATSAAFIAEVKAEAFKEAATAFNKLCVGAGPAEWARDMLNEMAIGIVNLQKAHANTELRTQAQAEGRKGE